MFDSNLVNAWNSHDGMKVAALYADQGVRHQIALEETVFTGRAEVATAAQQIQDAWPDSVLEVRGVIEKESCVVVEWTFRGTHQHDFGPLPGRGETTELNGVSVFDLDGGLIREERVYWDGATLLAGAGVLG